MPTSKSLLAAIGIVVFAAVPLSAQERHIGTTYVRQSQSSPVVIDYLDVTHPAGSLDFDNEPACITFHNTDSRTATAVRFAFVSYDAGGTRSRSDVLTRTGTFTQRQAIEGGKISSSDRKLESCQTLHRPTDYSLITYYVDHVDFADGTSWDASGLTFPDRAVPGTLRAVTPPQRDDALPLYFVQSYPTCAAALAASANSSDIAVNVAPGRPVENGLVHIGTVTPCQPETADALTPAHAAVIAALPRTIVRKAAFRIAFPVLSVSPACTTEPHLFRRELFPPGSPVYKRVIKAGTFTAIAHVSVRADGVADDAVVTVPAGVEQYDRQIVESALASRYWPAIAAGRPTRGTFDFAMRWTVGEERDDRLNVRVTGPALKPLPASCAPV